MDRTQIYLSEVQAAVLDRQAARTGLSRSQLIREAIDKTYLGESGDDALAVLESTAGAWNGRHEDGATFVKRLRSKHRYGRLSDCGLCAATQR